MSSSAPNTTSMSSSNTNTTVSSTQQQQQQQSQNQNVTESVPSPDTLVQCARLAIQQDKRVMLDYYNDSKADKAFIGQDPDTKERVLIKTKRDFNGENIYELCYLFRIIRPLYLDLFEVLN